MKINKINLYYALIFAALFPFGVSQSLSQELILECKLEYENIKTSPIEQAIINLDISKNIAIVSHKNGAPFSLNLTFEKDTFVLHGTIKSPDAIYGVLITLSPWEDKIKFLQSDHSIVYIKDTDINIPIRTLMKGECSKKI